MDFDPSMLQSIEMRTNQVTAQNSKEETILIPVETTPDVDIQTRVRPKDEMTEVFVSENGGFWIDQTEVSNEKYQRCVSERSCAKPVSLRSATRDQYYEAVEFANYPVIYLTASQAQAYCQWVGGKLPDQNEWEMAAGGSDGRKYPWGAEFDSGKLNNSGRQLGDTTPVSAYQEGASPYGALNMLGNVSEWISTRMTDETDPQQVYFLIKGGSYQTSDKDISIAFQELGKTSGDFSKIGFRCMRTE